MKLARRRNAEHGGSEGGMGVALRIGKPGWLGAALMAGLRTRLSRAALYAVGPFYCNPLKPLLNSLCGDGYANAFAHFRRDHSASPNATCS